MSLSKFYFFKNSTPVWKVNGYGEKREFGPLLGDFNLTSPLSFSDSSLFPTTFLSQLTRRIGWGTLGGMARMNTIRIKHSVSSVFLL